MSDPIEAEQIALCEYYSASFTPAPLNSIVGFAVETEDKLPINGLRHPPLGDTNGWYIWGGKELSKDPGFFSALHTQHLIRRKPEVIKYLGLPPGYRFLIAGDYVDVWFDPNLLDI
jgi:hypothetical protein